MMTLAPVERSTISMTSARIAVGPALASDSAVPGFPPKRGTPNGSTFKPVCVTAPGRNLSAEIEPQLPVHLMSIERSPPEVPAKSHRIFSMLKTVEYFIGCVDYR